MVIALILFILWMTPGVFISRWWFRQHWPERSARYDDGRMSQETIVGWTIAIAFFWLYYLIGYLLVRWFMP